MKNKRNGKWLARIFATFLVLFGYYLIIIPYATDWYYRIGQTATISGYKDSIQALSDEEIQNKREEMFKYNEMIATQHEEKFYRYSSKKDYDDTYLTLPVADNNQICTVEIPKINVNIPVGHGTDDDMLQTEVGHLYGTSLPIGGASTHAVMAGHSALRTAEMFSRLEELKLGDTIYINILNETHAYNVIETRVVLPEECDQYMQVVPGEDLITLYTCTPYGINSHRLLVTAKRGQDPVREESHEVMDITIDKTKPMIIFGGLVGGPLVVAVGINLYLFNKERRKENERKENDIDESKL